MQSEVSYERFSDEVHGNTVHMFCTLARVDGIGTTVVEDIHRISLVNLTTLVSKLVSSISKTVNEVLIYCIEMLTYCREM